MIVDPSAIVALLKREAGWETIRNLLDGSRNSSLSAASYLEVSIVIDSWRNPTLSRHLDELIEQFKIVIEPVTAEQARIARQAYRDYGKGSGHAAQLNFGDCFSYALARVKREPILFKGTDFQETDLRTATMP
ncbi:MAG TPA: type II toxin-antitoxin system VapC family toxin [Terracidiphilus sp.]|nr:type II toxin-antitoxin system VapC family toxin [Terracidiphilus sp.]